MIENNQLGISQFFWSSSLIGPWAHAEKRQSSCVCTFCTWFTTDTHLATISSPVDEEAADQYKWLEMLRIHPCTSSHPRCFAGASSLLETPKMQSAVNC